MDAEYSKGQRLLVVTKDGTWKGVFYSMCPDHNRLTLTEVVLHPSGKKIESSSHYRSEIISLHILDPGTYAGVSTNSEAAGNGNLMCTDQRAVQPGKVKELDVLIPVSRETAMSCTNLSEEEIDAFNKLIDNHVLIDCVGDKFRKAVEDIKAEPAVGLSMDGAMFGRYSQASLLSIATPSRAFLFDIYSLGDAAFDNGLRDILESKEILKVIHNFRIVADYLRHKHRVAICGVNDTQLLDVRVTQQQYGRVPHHVRSLPQCLSLYLNLPENLIYHPQIRDGSIVLDSPEWNSRPLPIELELGAVKNSVFLLRLRKEIWKGLWRLFYRCVDVYLSVVRDSDDPEAGVHLANNLKVPSELFELFEEP